MSITNMNAILFPEGPGYLLVSALSRGVQGDVYLVISLLDGKYYVRKRLDDYDKTYFEYESAGAAFYSQIPDNIAIPKLMSKVEYDDDSEAIVTEFCNGGDFLQVWRLCEKRKQPLPELLVWTLLRDLLKVLDVVHHLPNPVTHGDLHDGNIFVHWPEAQPLLPKFFLGDWDLLETWPKYDKLGIHMDNFNRERMTDLRGLETSLMNAEQCGRGGASYVKAGSPQAVYQKLLSEAEELYDVDPSGCNPTKYIADRILSLAEKNIADLSSRSTKSFRTLRPEKLSGKFAVFEEDQKETQLRIWEAVHSAEESKVRQVRPPWRWVAVSELPVFLQDHGKIFLDKTAQEHLSNSQAIAQNGKIDLAREE